MNTQFLPSNRAAAPVIGTILLVAVVVVLGAIVAVPTFDLAEDASSVAPQANIDFEVDEETGDIVVTHRDGDTFDGDQVRFAGAALEKTTFGSITEWKGTMVEAPDSATVDVTPGETLRLVWQSPNGRKSATLGTYEVPDDVGPTASIGSVSVNSVDGEVIVSNIQFNRAEKVYVVVDDENDVGGGADADAIEQYFSTSGGTLTDEFETDYYIKSGETVTVTVYETDSKDNELANASTKAS